MVIFLLIFFVKKIDYLANHFYITFLSKGDYLTNHFNGNLLSRIVVIVNSTNKPEFCIQSLYYCLDYAFFGERFIFIIFIWCF